MGTSAHIHIHVEGSSVGVGVYHRFDGLTLGPLLVEFATRLNQSAQGEQIAPTGFAHAWVASQNDQFRADMADFPDPDGRGAEIVEQMMNAIEVVVDEDVSAAPDWHDAYYSVTLDAGRVRTVNRRRVRWGPIDIPQD